MRPLVPVLVLLLIVSAVGCADESQSDPFYQPPESRAREALTLESGTESCRRWQELARANNNSSAAMERELQQQFLLFGFDEIRVDPLAPSTSSPHQHVTASVRGGGRDTVLVITLGVPTDRGNLAPLLSTARLWSERANPEEPPPTTVRFSVLPVTTEVPMEQIVANFLVQRPLVLAQTRAIVVLDGRAPPGLHTNRGELMPVLETVGNLRALPVHLVQDDAIGALGESLAATFSRFGLATIWADLGWQREQTNCSEAHVARAAVSSEHLLALIETLVAAATDSSLPEAQDVKTIKASI